MCMAETADGYGQFSGRKEVVARKAHRCGECDRDIIRPGDTYEQAKGLCDGVFWSAKTCGFCLAARRFLDVACNGWLYGAVWDDIAEHWDEDEILRTAALARLKLVSYAGNGPWPETRRRRWQWRGRDVTTADVERWVDEALEPLRRVQAA